MLTEAESAELKELEAEEWRAAWTAEFQELLTRIPPSIKSQVVEFKGVRIGIQILDKTK